MYRDRYRLLGRQTGIDTDFQVDRQTGTDTYRQVDRPGQTQIVR